MAIIYDCTPTAPAPRSTVSKNVCVGMFCVLTARECVRCWLAVALWQCSPRTGTGSRSPPHRITRYLSSLVSCAALWQIVRNANLHACLALHRPCSKPLPLVVEPGAVLAARVRPHAHAVINNHKKGRCEFAQPHLSPRTARSRGQSHPISGETPDPPQRRLDLGVEISLPWCGRMGAEGGGQLGGLGKGHKDGTEVSKFFSPSPG